MSLPALRILPGRGSIARPLPTLLPALGTPNPQPSSRSLRAFLPKNRSVGTGFRKQFSLRTFFSEAECRGRKIWYGPRLINTTKQIEFRVLSQRRLLPWEFEAPLPPARRLFSVR